MPKFFMFNMPVLISFHGMNLLSYPILVEMETFQTVLGYDFTAIYFHFTSYLLPRKHQLHWLFFTWLFSVSFLWITLTVAQRPAFSVQSHVLWARARVLWAKTMSNAGGQSQKPSKIWGKGENSNKTVVPRNFCVIQFVRDIFRKRIACLVSTHESKQNGQSV